MKCPFCGAPDTQVVDSRVSEEGDSIRRRRRCGACDKRFTTYETVELRMPSIVKANGIREEFDADKLRTGFVRALHKRPVPTEYVDAAIEANPNDPRGYALKTRALDLSGDPANAIPVGQAGLNVDRNFAPLYAALSSAYRSIDRYDTALQNAERAIELDPTDPSSRRIYAYALVWVGRTDEAIDQLEQAVQLNPNLAGPYFELAGMYRARAGQSQDTVMAQELYASSIALYEQILAMQPENARAYLRLCDAYFEARENRRAQDYCAQAVTINPQYAQAWASLGQTQYSQRNYEGAIESFEQCVALAGGEADIRCFYLRGLAHYYLGQCDEAWTILSDSVERIRATSSDQSNPVLQASQEGLRLVTVSCPAYTNRPLPTAIPPTAIPPTPIGG